jgi:hypothetical protein
MHSRKAVCTTGRWEPSVYNKASVENDNVEIHDWSFVWLSAVTI